jgi:hypothetical protein
MGELSDAILKVTKDVTKEWTKQRKAEERGSRNRYSRAYVYSDRVNFSDLCHRILPGAYAHASGDGKYSVSKRQLYYACRETFKDRTGRQLEYGYFANALLVQYLNRHPETTAWKITADPRGTLTIPNSAYEVRVPVGTIQIDNHLREAGESCGSFDDLQDAGMHIQWPSLAAGQRYQAVMYIEKEGFEPLLQEAEIAKRFDLAVISCKGQSVVAARRFADEVCALGRGVPLLVVHDFDKYGFEISQRLTTVSDWAEMSDRVTYEFKNSIDVHDLGLRIEDIKELGLEDHAEECGFSGRFASDSIATEEERQFLRSGRRVELNAMTSPQFVQWLETKLAAHLPGRLIPSDDVLANAYRRALAVARTNRVIEKVAEGAAERAQSAKIPKSLRRRLQKRLKECPAEAWDEALYQLAQARLDRRIDRREKDRPGD